MDRNYFTIYVVDTADDSVKLGLMCVYKFCSTYFDKVEQILGKSIRAGKKV
jgi:hypothetical protein